MLENKQLDNALEVIRSGGIIAYPTESIFGLGCDPFSQNAVLNLLALKLIMLRSNRGDLTKYWMLDLNISYFQIKSRAMHFRCLGIYYY